MSTTESLLIAVLVGYAIYKQTRVSELKARGRFNLAICYAVVGLCVGGIAVPHGGRAVGLFVGSFALSAIVGVARGRLTQVWVDSDGRVMRRGTAVTVGLFLALIVVKVGIGAYEFLAHIRSGAGFGEVMTMIALMVAVQAEIVFRRGSSLRSRGVLLFPPARRGRQGPRPARAAREETAVEGGIRWPRVARKPSNQPDRLQVETRSRRSDRV